MAVQEGKQELWGAETTKAVENFPVSGAPVSGGTRVMPGGAFPARQPTRSPHGLYPPLAGWGLPLSR